MAVNTPVLEKKIYTHHIHTLEDITQVNVANVASVCMCVCKFFFSRTGVFTAISVLELRLVLLIILLVTVFFSVMFLFLYFVGSFFPGSFGKFCVCLCACAEGVNLVILLTGYADR